MFISQVRAAGGSPPQSQLPVEDVFWNATILHTTDITQPSQSALSKQSVHSGKTSTRQDISVGYFILPAYSQDTADASQVECVEPSFLRGIFSPLSIRFAPHQTLMWLKGSLLPCLCILLLHLIVVVVGFAVVTIGKLLFA